ncbi:hypothetical protein NR798_23650 [Archangium gephyra]|uniref:hypothetical protein n=1 Tax=Archangium gephyra TaxID=48 RepID=UPI0035D50E37
MARSLPFASASGAQVDSTGRELQLERSGENEKARRVFTKRAFFIVELIGIEPMTS